jgi:hypothetical protein
MSDSSGPASPINGSIPADREYRIVDTTVVEQWFEWAGFWDVACLTASDADAKRYIREHEANETSTYRVAGLRRQRGAIGIFESFLMDQVATNVEEARDAAIRGCYDTGFEHVQIRAVVRVTDVDSEISRLADTYWRERQAPGGTLVDDNERVTAGPKARNVWDALGDVTEQAAAENEATLSRCGVPAELAKLLASHKDLTLEATCLRWTGFAGTDTGHHLDQVISPPLRHIEAWCNSFRWVWTDDVRLMITYCEGDLSGQLHFTPEAYAAAYADADRFYEDH